MDLFAKWMAKQSGFIANLGAEHLTLLVLLFLGLLAHGLNMFDYPASLGDEGIYTAQAYSVLYEGQLAPYGFWYDHTPAGWIGVALWMAVTGGVHAFGSAIHSGRALMLLLHLLTMALLYNIARKFGVSIPIASLGIILFTVSPLANYYQRMLLLDNIMIVWILISIYLLLDNAMRLSRILLSGFCFGIAVLCKESAVFLLPAMLYMVMLQKRPHHGRFAFIGWILPMFLVVSWYPLYAILRGELLPSIEPVLLSPQGTAPSSHNSLIGALVFQLTRSGGSPLNFGSLFWYNIRDVWFPLDPILVLGGIGAVVVNLFIGIRDRWALAVALLGLLPILYLASGGIVFEFYILFAIPFLCLNSALLLASLLNRVPVFISRIVVALIPGILIVVYLLIGALTPLYTEHPDQARQEAIAWVKTYIPSDSVIITRDDLFNDLKESNWYGPAFPNVHIQSKVAADPNVKFGIFHNSWQTVDYLLAPSGFKEEFVGLDNTVALEALRHSDLVKRWTVDGNSIELWKVNKQE